MSHLSSTNGLRAGKVDVQYANAVSNVADSLIKGPVPASCPTRRISYRHIRVPGW